MLRLWALPSFDLEFLWPGFHISCKSKQSNSLTRTTMRILFKSGNRATISAVIMVLVLLIGVVTKSDSAAHLAQIARRGLDEGFPERASRASDRPKGPVRSPFGPSRAEDRSAGSCRRGMSAVAPSTRCLTV